MEQTKAQEPSNIQKLKGGINELIAEYRQAHALLNEQMQAVINNDVLSLNELLEEQVAIYETLKESETKLKRQLQALYRHSGTDQTISLGGVIEGLEGPAQTLNNLRGKLHKSVEKTEKLRLQLMNLLQFAQQQNAEIFKAICKAAEDNSEAYDETGKKQAQRRNGIAINQQA